MAAPPRRELHDPLDQRSREHTRRDAVAEALDAGEQRVHFIGAQVDLEPICFDCFGDAIGPGRQLGGQLREIDSELL